MGNRFDRRPAEGDSTTLKKVSAGYSAVKSYAKLASGNLVGGAIDGAEAVGKAAEVAKLDKLYKNRIKKTNRIQGILNLLFTGVCIYLAVKMFQMEEFTYHTEFAWAAIGGAVLNFLSCIITIYKGKDYRRSIIGLLIVSIIVIFCVESFKSGMIYFVAIFIGLLVGALLNLIAASIADAVGTSIPVEMLPDDGGDVSEKK